jgi:hypothetical protein
MELIGLGVTGAVAVVSAIVRHQTRKANQQVQDEAAHYQALIDQIYDRPEMSVKWQAAQNERLTVHARMEWM